ncbi:GTPase domain-containing protein [Massilia sp. R2A-15]|uniref:GTPase domain-containing protein n=1 Tax=Massilia sp. R2A-15 TaxID=3064278 RepID=UPI002736F1B0|nr:GTPase domain-containing protein [Massilia sp. R2A-15]WLI89648.1 GTPase domain-containing protein [Massilia sp. R2A-15]
MSGVTIQFALISHTNNGKTTLARTLVGMDVGEVRDAAHVTVFAESHTLLTTSQGDSLQLWDTPGFGDSVRLLRRLALAGNPIGWFLREVVDRYRDRTFWLSQNALRTARDAADVVLYLVNSSEHPRDAGYLPAEMKILEWLGKPVVVLLNQMGPPRPAPEELAEQATWKQHLAQYPIVREVLALDAFARCWVHERVFYEAVGKLIEPAGREGYARLFAAWEANNTDRFRRAMDITTQQLLAAARDNEPVEEEKKSVLRSAMNAVGLRKDAEKRAEKAMAAMLERLNGQVGAATGRLLALHQLDPGEAAKINARVRQNFAIRAPVDKAQAGLIGAIVSGAATGLSADLMAGGLTLGGGALLGGLVGALTFAGAAWGFNASTDRNHPTVQFADDFLKSLLVSSILRYLAVAHFGRGRGNFVDSEAPAFWQAEVERAVAMHDDVLGPAWREARMEPDAVKAKARLDQLVTAVAARTLEQLYPSVTAVPGRATI